MYSSTFSYCGGVVTGPTCVSASIGSPMPRRARDGEQLLDERVVDACPARSRREPAMQVWPVAAKMPEIAPFTACSRSASSNTMLGDLPPSSSAMRLKPRAAFSLITAARLRRAPVKAILRPAGARTSGVADLGAEAGDDVDHAGRKARPRRTSSANSSVDAEVNSDGLITTVLPAASAGAIFQAVSSSGEFHGVIAATTPTGS